MERSNLRNIEITYLCCLLYWMEPYERYRDVYHPESLDHWPGYHFTGEVFDKNCLIYHNPITVELVSCDDKYSAICAYESLKEKSQSFCSLSRDSLCKQSKYSTDSLCFCPECKSQNARQNSGLAEFLQRHQNLLFETSSQLYIIGLARENGKFIWKTSRKEIEYTNWASDTSFNDEYVVGALSNGKWKLLEGPSPDICSIYQISIPDNLSPELIVKHTTDSHFVVTLTDGSSWIRNSRSDPYVFCFTDSDNYQIIRKLPTTFAANNNSGITFTMDITLEPGNVWCEAHAYPNIERKISNKFLFRIDGSFQGEYVVILKYKYSVDDPLCSSFLRRTVDELTEEIDKKTPFLPRIFKVVDIDKDMKTATLNFHLSYSDSKNSSAEYSALKNVFSELNSTKFEFVQFSNSYYCMGNMTPIGGDYLHWPESPIGSEAYPLGGYCVKKNGVFVKRLCEGNFIDGAQWRAVDDDCSFYESANITDTLFGILNQEEPTNFLDNVKDLSACTSNLTLLDVYLFSEIISKVSCENESTLNTIAQIVSNLMGVSGDILSQSQQEFKATDRLLNNIDVFSTKCTFESTFVEKNFAVVSVNIGTSLITGVAVETLNSNLEYTVKTIKKGTDVTLSNLEGAVQISDDLFQQLTTSKINQRLIVCVYFNNALFTEANSTRATSIIFGVLLPDFEEEFKGPLIVTFNDFERNIDNFNCSYWQYDADNDNSLKGFWENDGDHDNVNKYFICHFYHLTHFSAVAKDVTAELENILHSTDLEEQIGTLATITDLADLFQTEDLYLLLKIFKRIYEESIAADADFLTNIISDLFQVDKDILLEAEVENNTIQEILQYYTDIISRVNNVSMFEQRNMVTVLSPISDISAITVSDCRKNCKVRMYNININMENDIDVGLVLSNELREETLAQKHISKIIVTIFFNDFLFVNTADIKCIFSPVSIHFSNNVKGINNLIHIFYNIELVDKANASYSCAFFNETNNIWQLTDEVSNNGNISVCAFNTEGQKYALVDTNSEMNPTSNLKKLDLELNTTNFEAILPKAEALCRFFWKIDAAAIDIISDMIYFVADEIQDVKPEVIDYILAILDNLIHVSTSTLLWAQTSYNATNRILEGFASVAAKCNSEIVSRTKYILLSTTLLSDENKGVGVTKDNEIVYPENFNSSNPLNLKYVILPSESFLQKMLENDVNNTTKYLMVTAIFFSDQLFLSNLTNDIIHVNFPKFRTTFSDTFYVLFYYDYTVNISNYQQCALWEDDAPQNWKLHCGYEEMTFKNCTYRNSGYFTLTESPNKNITNLLDDILNMESENAVILCLTRDVSNFCSEFCEEDINRVVEILNKVTIENDEDIQNFVELIDNLLDTPETVLKNSYNSTTQILDNIIAKFSSYINDNSPYYLYKQNNFAVNIWTPQQENIYGCMLDTNSSLSIIYDNSLPAEGELDCALILSEELLSSLRNEGKTSNVVITIYFNDKLFSQTNVQRSKGKIFGVSIPDMEKKSAGNISLFYNITGTEDLAQCAIWSKETDSTEWFWNPTYEQVTPERNVRQCDFREGQHFALVKEGAITLALEEILNDGSDISTKLENLFQIVVDSYSLFVASDIDLISKILEIGKENAIIDLKIVADIIDTLMLVPKPILQNAQSYFRATDRILISMQTMCSHYETSEKAAFLHNNLYIGITKFTPSSTTCGFVLSNCKTKCTVSELTQQNASIPADIKVFFSEEFLTYLKSGDHTVVLTVFTNDAFFYDPLETGAARAIIGATVPNLDQEFDSPVISVDYSQSFFSSRSRASQCASWKIPSIGQSGGRWDLESIAIENLTIHCTFQTINNNFAVLEREINITSTLNNTLVSTVSFSDKLTSLNALLDLYEEFSCYDLYLTVNILSIDEKKILKSDIESLGGIVNKIMKIPKNVLTKCNKDYNVANGVLLSTDKTLKKYNSKSTNFISENFATFIINFDDQHEFTGLVIENCLYTSCTVSIKSVHTSLSPVVDVDLEFSESLLNQLKDAGSVIMITVFLSDVLFTQVITQSVSKVIGVLLPENINSFNGPIQISYNLQAANKVCAFWYFGDGSSSFWKNDSEPTGNAVCQFFHITHFALVQITSERTVTEDLEDILTDENAPPEDKLVSVKNITSNQYQELADIDIYFIAKILLQAVQQNFYSINLTSSIVSDLFLVEPSVMSSSQQSYNATDLILHCVDETERSTYEESFYVYDHFAVIVSLYNSTTGGLLLENCSEARCDISLQNVSISQVSTNKNLDAAIIFSDELRNQMHENESSRIMITVHFKNIFFNENSEISRNTTKIFGVLLPDLKTTMSGNISFAFNSGHNYDDSCAYWDFQTNQNGDVVQQGRWSKNNLGPSIELISTCEFDHLTHFALLLLSNDENFKEFYESLDVITNVCCCLSLLGVLGIVTTAILFARWRRNTGNQILVNFAFAIILQIIMMYVSAVIYDNHSSDIACTVTGAILHYALLSEFCWMLIIAILQFRRFVEVLGGPPKHVFMKALVCGWMFPIFPVVLVLAVDPQNYTTSHVGLCYPTELGLYLGVYLPVVLIVCINVVIFVFIMFNVFHKRTEYRDTDNHEILFQWRLALLLFSMLGLTWLFGFLAQITQWVGFVYLFCVTASLQGFIMFLFFIVFNKRTRFLYSQAIKFWLYNKGWKDKI